MVGNVTSLTNNGLRDWLIQRVTALVLAAYTIFLLIFLVMHHDLDFSTWQELFASTFVRTFSLLALLSVLLHAWIGLWTISTDYLKCVYGRLSFQIITFLALLSFFIWGIEILWGF